MHLEHLTVDELTRLRAFRASEGQERAAVLLGVAEVTLETLLGGNPVKPDTAQRLRCALAKLPG